MDNSEDFFEKYGLEIVNNNIEVGEVYPLYGIITKFLSEEVGNILVEINYSIEAKMSIDDLNKLNILKERAFEPAIFISKVVEKEPKIIVDCSTIVFGRKQNIEMQ